uniref:Uncharacterized protein n=1 Tax=Dunaliella tertiolecta TaxID=3047 RepID=A0A7S3QV94_DUNTE
MDAEAMAGLCEAVQQQVHNKMWLPVLTKQAPSSAGSQQQQETQLVDIVLRYQAVVKRSGEVVGCMPCDKTSMAWYQHMPLSTAIRSRKLQEKQHRHLEAARPDAPKPTPLASFIAPAERARYASMPPDGLVVLQVELRQQLHEAVAMSSKTSSLGANAKSTLFGGKPNQGSDKGQEEVLWAPLHAHVRPWCDEDSVYNMLSYDAQISRGVGSLQRAAGSAQGQGHEQQQQQYKNQQLKEQYEQQGGQPIKVAGGTDQGQSIEATIQQIVQQLIKATEASDQAKQQQRGPASSQVGEVSMKDDLPGGKNGK